MHRRALILSILILLASLLVGLGSTRAQDATPPASGSSILEAYGEAWSSGDAATVGALYTENAVREDIPTGTTSTGRAEIEAFAAGLFKTDDDVRLEVTDGFSGETWAVVEWMFQGVRQGTEHELIFRGASVLELEGGLISRESNYYDLPDLQQQMAAAGGTPAAMETPAGETTAAENTSGAVTVRVYACPTVLSGGEPDLATLQAACTPLSDDWAAPALDDLDSGESMSGTVTTPGVYDWTELALGSYGIGGTGEQPADMHGLLVMNASGMPLQNPVAILDEATPHAEVSYFWFLPEGTPAP